VGVKTVARELRSVFHGHPDDQPTVATVDLSRLDLEQDVESAIAQDLRPVARGYEQSAMTATVDLTRLETDDESPSA
jgi:hypothetical protein